MIIFLLSEAIKAHLTIHKYNKRLKSKAKVKSEEAYIEYHEIMLDKWL